MDQKKYSIILFGNDEPVVFSYDSADKRNALYNELKNSIRNGKIFYSNKSYLVMQSVDVLETFFTQQSN